MIAPNNGHICTRLPCYSYRRASTGFARAMRIAWPATVPQASNVATIPAASKMGIVLVNAVGKEVQVHAGREVGGRAARSPGAQSTGVENCHTSRRAIWNEFAPSTLRTPISLVRCVAMKAASPKRPMSASANAMNAKLASAMFMILEDVVDIVEGVVEETTLHRVVGNDPVPDLLDLLDGLHHVTAGDADRADAV